MFISLKQQQRIQRVARRALKEGSASELGLDWLIDVMNGESLYDSLITRAKEYGLDVH